MNQVMTFDLYSQVLMHFYVFRLNKNTDRCKTECTTNIAILYIYMGKCKYVKMENSNR